MICTFVQIKMVRPTDNDDATPRKANLREAILCAAEDLFSTNGFNAVSVRDIAQAAGANPGSVTYHFKTKDGLLLEIYRRHCGPMNLRRSELLAAAQRVRELNDRLGGVGGGVSPGGARWWRQKETRLGARSSGRLLTTRAMPSSTRSVKACRISRV